MLYKKQVQIIYYKAVEIEADSLEEAKEMIENGEGEWYDLGDYDDYDEGEEVWFVATEFDEDGDVDEWEMIEEE